MTRKTSTTAPDQESTNSPALIAYHVPDRDGAKWLRIGAAWPNKDGKGFTLQLDMLPVNFAGRIALRNYEPKEQEVGA